MERQGEDKSNMTKVILSIGLLCILLGAGMSFVINVEPEEGDLVFSDFQQAGEGRDNRNYRLYTNVAYAFNPWKVTPENPRFKNLQEIRLRDKLFSFIKDEENQGKVDRRNILLLSYQ